MAQPQKRMSPKAQSNARAMLQADLQNVATGDAEVDSLMNQLVAQRHTFAAPGRDSTPAKMSFVDTIKKLLGMKK